MPYKQIASQHRVSFRDISRVAKEMYGLSAFDVFGMVAKGMNPIEIAEKTGAGFAEVKRLYEDSVSLLESASKHKKALEELNETEFHGLLDTIEKEQLAKVEAKYVCFDCGEPLPDAKIREKCPKCGSTRCKKVEEE